MTNKNYQRGYKTELRAVHELRKDGFYAYRSAGSHGIFDVFAIKEDAILAIQCKRIKKSCNELSTFKKDIESIRSARVPLNVQKQLWVWEDRKGWNKIVVGDD